MNSKRPLEAWKIDETRVDAQISMLKAQMRQWQIDLIHLEETKLFIEKKINTYDKQ